MANPIVNQMSQQQMMQMLIPQAQRVKQILGVIRTANNPQAMIQNIIAQNPKIKEVQSVINQYGNLKDAFYGRARELGVNPDEFLSLLQ